MNELIKNVFEAGIVGCGGAGFPTHVKLNAKPDYLIVNGAECEPLLATDRYIMRCHADEVVKAVAAIKESLGSPVTVIALKETYTDEIGSLKAAISTNGADIGLCLPASFYPAGDEQALVYEATGRTVPPGGIPLDVGCVVINAATVYNIFYAQNGISFTRKILTVSGAVRRPTVMSVPLGTPFTECIEHAGGASLQDYSVVSGGPLMGRYMSKEEARGEFVAKTTSGILVLPREKKPAEPVLERLKNRAKCSCIQCTYCTELCPRYLLGLPLEPHKIMRTLAFSTDTDSLLAEPVIKNALLCCECGVCEIYACPMGLHPRKVNAFIKKEYAKRGVRYAKIDGSGVSPYRDERKVPSKRMAARAGVIEYYDVCKTDACALFGSQRVELMLKQHAGAPSLPIIKSGDSVTEGQKIAVCPEGQLGANLHASISGTAEVTADRIVISGEPTWKL